MKMQDELASIFNQTMNLSQPPIKAPSPQLSRPPSTPTANFSISQHYHHSAHLVPTVQSLDQPTFESGLTEADIEGILIQHNLNRSLLSSSQLDLFGNANPEQRDRLIELWSISPPEVSNSIGHTTLEKEIELARKRYDRRSANETMGNTKLEEEKPAVEPYIKSGYEMLAERDYHDQVASEKLSNNPPGIGIGVPHALDPAFSSREWWRDFVGEQPMELQYGMLEHLHNYQAQQPVGGQEDTEMM